MPELIVGSTIIPYDLRRSANAKDRRITVTPHDVEVVVPVNTSDEDILDFVNRKRRWVYDQTEIMKEMVALQPSICRFIAGAKILYRGRRLRLKVGRTTDADISISYRNGFLVNLPEWVRDESRDTLVDDAFRLWFKRRVRHDVEAFARHYGYRHELKPKGIRIKDQKHLWGSCGRDRVINLNWHLIFAPKAVLEYAVVHELAHLKHRNHSLEFWALLRSILPDYKDRKVWLDRNDHLLGMRRVGLIHESLD